MKVLHTADLHIGAEQSFLGADAQNRQYEILATFKNITALCESEEVDVCLIAGDLFDSNVSGQSFADSVFRYIENAKNTKFFYVAGNHDPLDASSPFMLSKLPENLTVFDTDYQTVIVEDLNLRICGRSFAHSAMEFCDMPTMPQDEFINILLLHGDLGGTGGVYNPISTAFIGECGADYLALGHIHKRSEVERLGKTSFAYSGCPEGQGFDELGLKGVYLGEITKEKVDLSFVPCSNRLHVFKKFDLSAAGNTAEAEKVILEALAQEFGDSFKQNLYKITLKGQLDNPEVINAAELAILLKEKLYFVKLKNKIKQKVDLELLSKENSLKGIFVNKMLLKIKEAEGETQKLLVDALYLGLNAFSGEVAFDED